MSIIAFLGIATVQLGLLISMESEVLVYMTGYGFHILKKYVD